MGLAPYGEPPYLPEMRRIVACFEGGGFELDTTYFRHHHEKIDYEWSGGSPHVGTLFSPALEDLLGPRARQDEPLSSAIAISRARCRPCTRRLSSTCSNSCTQAPTGQPDARRRLRDEFGGQRQGQARNALQAGLCPIGSRRRGWRDRRCDACVAPTWRPKVQGCKSDRALGPCRRRAGRPHGHGPRLSRARGPGGEIEALLAARAADLERPGCRVERIADESELCRKTAEAIAAGMVVGWFQGRMEWGPRALGNRSIVCDPRRADMKDILNLKIKRRESFRPFAPSILREHVGEWFEEDDDVPFMMQVFQIREEKRPLIPAVTHVDGSGRLQTVHRANEPALLAASSSLSRIYGCADGTEHLVQRERAGRLPSGRGVGLLPAHGDGCLGLGCVVRLSSVKVTIERLPATRQSGTHASSEGTFRIAGSSPPRRL